MSQAIVLSYLRVLRVSGSNATDFLQAQLSRRVDDLSPALSALAGWHDARGRVRAVFRVLALDDGYLLSAPADLAEQLAAALRLFVLRADVRVEVAPLVCSGILGSVSPSLPALPARSNAVAREGDALAVCVTHGCWHIIGPAAGSAAAGNVDSASIVAAEIRAGIPQVDRTTTLRYVPHMLNLDKLDAIDFRKGCFPGQEIIARTENLGSVKRRACVFTFEPQVPAAAAPGSDTAIVDAQGERIGEVLRAARETGGPIVLLAVVALAALKDAVHLGTPDGPMLKRLELPFE
ncbi:MAG: hypothetical protein PVF63_05695 [Gammaproteobacteria bacterium]